MYEGFKDVIVYGVESPDSLEIPKKCKRIFNRFVNEIFNSLDYSLNGNVDLYKYDTYDWGTPNTNLKCNYEILLVQQVDDDIEMGETVNEFNVFVTVSLNDYDDTETIDTIKDVVSETVDKYVDEIYFKDTEFHDYCINGTIYC